MSRHGSRWLWGLFWLAALAHGGERPVYLAVPLSLQPYYIAPSDEGLAYETLKAAFAVQGRDVFPVYVSQKDLPGVLGRRTHIDCAGHQTESDSAQWHAIDELYPYHDHVITLADQGIQIRDAGDLLNLKVLADLGSKEEYGSDFRELMARNPRYREIYNHRAQVKLLLRGRVQVIIADRLLVDWYVRYLTQESGEPAELTYHELFPPGRLKFACRNPELVRQLNEGLEAIRRNGELARIRSRYLD